MTHADPIRILHPHLGHRERVEGNAGGTFFEDCVSPPNVFRSVSGVEPTPKGQDCALGGFDVVWIGARSEAQGQTDA